MTGNTRVEKKQAPLFPLGPTSTEVKVSIRRVSMKLTVLDRNRPFQWTSQTLHTNQLNPLSIFEKNIYIIDILIFIHHHHHYHYYY